MLSDTPLGGVLRKKRLELDAFYDRLKTKKAKLALHYSFFKNMIYCQIGPHTTPTAHPNKCPPRCPSHPINITLLIWRPPDQWFLALAMH